MMFQILKILDIWQTGKKDTTQLEEYTQVFEEKHGFINNLNILDLLLMKKIRCGLSEKSKDLNYSSVFFELDLILLIVENDALKKNLERSKFSFPDIIFNEKHNQSWIIIFKYTIFQNLFQLVRKHLSYPFHRSIYIRESTIIQITR